MFSAGKATNELLKVSMKDFLKIMEAAQKGWQRRWDWPHVPPRTAAGRRLHGLPRCDGFVATGSL